MPADHRPGKEASDLKILGRLIVHLRNRQGISQQDLAKTIGTSKSQLSKWERGQANLQMRSREKIAAAFGLSHPDFEALAQWLDRSVSRHLARLRRSADVVDPPQPIDAESLRSHLDETRLRRRDLEAERADIDEALRAVDHEEQSLRFELKMLEGADRSDGPDETA